MASDKPRGAKTQNLSLRLDPKTRFVLDFVARIKGQSITTVVERAIMESASQVGLGVKSLEGGRTVPEQTWSDFWDPSEGVRTLKLLRNRYYPKTYDEDDLLAFSTVHWQFFYKKPNAKEPRRDFVQVLWPKIESYLEIWQEKRSEDYWAAGKAMKADLLAARVVAKGELDDELPC